MFVTVHFFSISTPLLWNTTASLQLPLLLCKCHRFSITPLLLCDTTTSLQRHHLGETTASRQLPRIFCNVMSRVAQTHTHAPLSLSLSLIESMSTYCDNIRLSQNTISLLSYSKQANINLAASSKKTNFGEWGGSHKKKSIAIKQLVGKKHTISEYQIY